MKPLSFLALAVLAVPFVLSASEAAAPARPIAEGGEFAVDPVHSTVVFKTRHVGVANFYGRFNDVSGTLLFNEEDPAQSHVEIEVDASSIDTNSERRDGHLRSPDFLSVREYPLIRFESTAVRGSGDELEVEGELTLRGETKAITAPVRVVGRGDTPFNDYRTGFEARFEVEPRDYGFGFMVERPEALGPGVELIVSLECIRQ